MMKDYFPKVCFVLFFIAAWTTCSYAEEWVPATDLDTAWVISSGGDGAGTVSTKDATINLTANGASNGSFYGALNKAETTGIAGIVATLRVDRVSRNCNLGLKATIGQIGNKQIQISIFFTQYDQLNNIIGKKSIGYNINMFDMDAGQSDLVAAGIFGAWDGGWIPGKSLLVGCARFGSELWFYADGFKQMHKIQMQEGIVPLYGDVAGYVYASKGADVSIAGSISDILLYYP